MTEPLRLAVPDSPRGLADSDANELLLIAGGAVDSAARLLVEGRSHLGALIAKGDRDYASRADFQIEDAIRDALARATRDIPFLGEERGGHLNAPLFWVLDPIDGTTNFIKGSSLCAISLALLADGQPIFGIIDLPLVGERYVARAGAGAYLNGTRLRMPDAHRLVDVVIGITDFAVADDRSVENPIHIGLLGPARAAGAGSANSRIGRAGPGLARGRAPRRFDDALQPRVGRECGGSGRTRGGGPDLRLGRIGAQRRLSLYDRLRAELEEQPARTAPGGLMSSPSLVVFAPSPLLTITVEAAGTAREEIHLHAGGQGFWVARMAALLGVEVSLCCALGGESGAVLRALIARENVELLSVECAASNGVYIHARRGGVREQLARTQCEPLSRHESDELYGVALSAALDADVALLTGVDPPTVLDSEIYRRLAGDLRSNGVKVIADLTGPSLKAALAGGVDLLKISEEEILGESLARSSGLEDLLEASHELHEAGAGTVLISRAEEPALVLNGASGHYLELTGPRVETLEPRGTGDSMFAALGASLASGQELDAALRLAMAAGALNATRHGLGTGTRQQIQRLSRHIEVNEMIRPARPVGDADQ